MAALRNGFGAVAVCATFLFILVWVVVDRQPWSSYRPVPYAASRDLRPPAQVNSTQSLEMGEVSRLPFDAPASPRPKVKVLLLTYLRSGSTFTGDLFDQNPDVFYVFEPLHSVSKPKGESDQGTVLFWNKASWETKKASVGEIERVQDDVIQGYFNCRFIDVFPEVMSDWFLTFGIKTKPFNQCLKLHPGIMGILRCLPQLQRPCIEAKVVVLKTIRYTVNRTLTLMERDPQVKVIHLIRDPRGTLQSQKRVGELTGRSVDDYCREAENDLVTGAVAIKRFPRRFLRVRYEDIALEPVAFARKLLDFVGLRLSDQQQKYLEMMTSGPTFKQCDCIDVQKTNSTATAASWREKSDFSFTSRIDSRCKRVYELAGFLPVKTEKQLRDVNLPSMLKTGSVSGFLG